MAHEIEILTPEEAAKRNDGLLRFWVFVFGAGFAGWLAYTVTADMALAKPIRMAAVLVPGISVGAVFVVYRYAIASIFLYTFILLVLLGVLSAIYLMM